MTAAEVLERIKKNLGVPWNERTYRDTFKVGGPETVVTGIATTFMASLDLLQRAHAGGLNMVIPHEVTFWNDRDDIMGLQDDPIYRHKTEFCAANRMVVLRLHDHSHAHRPDFIWTGLARAMGWEGHDGTTALHKFSIPPTTLEALASEIQRRMKTRALRVVGDPKAKVTTIAVGLGYNIPRPTYDVDVTIGGENPETNGAFDATEYVRDAATLGIPKGQIILGHAISEEPGMEDCATWLRTFITEVPVQFVRAGEPFWAPAGAATHRA
jgi:putative NIF3 family GTP cyclohydrolase 1 type 2